MARHQTSCPWYIEFLEAVLIFAAGMGMCALGTASSRRHSRPLVVALCLAGLPAIIMLGLGVRLGLYALRKRKERDDEEEAMQGVAGHGVPRQNQQPRGSIQLPAIAIAQLQQLQAPATGQEGVYGGAGVGDQECAICLARVGDDGLAMRQLPACRPAFHEHCIVQWLRVHPTCPICRCDARPRPPPEVILRINTSTT